MTNEQIMESLRPSLEQKRAFAAAAIGKFYEEQDYPPYTEEELNRTMPNQMNTTLKLPCDVREVSDGYHTFAELYDHRAVLLISLMRAFPKISWRSQLHDDGTMFGGFFVAGMGLPAGMITYHLEMKFWTFFDGTEVETRDKAPPFDGHSPSDVIYRLLAWMHPECSQLQLPDKD